MDFGEKILVKNNYLFDFVKIELMTTPQLHYAVRCYNDDGLYGHYTEAGYFDKLCTAFQNILQVRLHYSFFVSYGFILF